MGDEGEVLDDLYAMWVEVHVLQGGASGDWELKETNRDPKAVASLVSEASSSGPTAPNPPEGPLRGSHVAEPIGETPPVEDVAQGDVERVVGVDPRVSFEPSHFWLLLAQVGYELWLTSWPGLAQ